MERMRETLACRGPDAAGSWFSPHAALGHRRLSVIDIAGGAQPMQRRQGERTCVIVYNGELYNMPELRRDLEARGHVLRTRSDTELVLAAYMEWGSECVERLNGIFAFAVWDEAAQSLFLARDRLGVKPLFYTHFGSTFLFGSELKSVLAHPAVRPELDEEGLAEVFCIGPARTPGHGVFRGLYELKPGHWLVFDRKGLRQQRYWALESQPHTDDVETTARTIRYLLADAVQRQLVSDVTVCTLLSGGLDSSAITAFACQALERAGRGPFITYSVDYVDNDRYFQPNEYQPNADTPWIERVSRFLGTEHRSVVVNNAELAEALQAAVRARDLPGMADVDSSLYLFCREVKKGATVALTGESADEVFGGYPWFRNPEAIAAGTFPWARMTAKRARLLAPEVAARIRPMEYVAERYREALAEVPRLPGEDPREARMREMLYLNITRFMPMLLDRMDRMSMAVGLEVRVPYCDHRLVEYVWNIPWAMKSHGNREKGILRRALTGVLPPDVLERRKSPYPKTHHPAYTDAVRTWLSAVLDDPRSPLVPLLDVDYVREVIHTNAAGFNPAWFSQLMGGPQLFAYLAQVDHWLREYHISIR